MDVLYIVRGDSLDLRYSLRSLEKHASNVGRVIVAGTDIPRWLSDDVVRVEVRSPFDRKQKNILYAILETMRKGVVQGPCLYSSDDHFLLAPYDFDAFPWFARPGLYSRSPPAQPNAYRMSVFVAGHLLAANGLYHGHRLDGHWNTHLDARDLQLVERLVHGYEWTAWGVEPSTPFVAAGIAMGRCPGIAVKPDRKLTSDDLDFDDEARKYGGMLSARALDASPKFAAWLGKRFPERCRWEKE